MLVASKFSTVLVAVFVAVASYCANIVFLANLFVATASTNTRNATFKIVHSDLLNKTWNVYQQYENVTIENNSMFKNL